jgi:O-antigen/teichoic acid export membrane protein
MILLVGFGISNIFFWNRSLLLSFGNAHIPLYVMAGAGVLKIGLSLLLVPRFGMNVEALLLSAYFVLTVGIMVILGYDLIKKAEVLEKATGEE